MEKPGPDSGLILFTTPWCPYCVRAKQLLKQKDVAFEDINVSFKTDLRAKLVEWTGKTSVPQIFLNGELIGGCDDLFALDRKGELDPKLAKLAG